MATGHSSHTLQTLVSQTTPNSQIGLICRSPVSQIAKDVQAMFGELSSQSAHVSVVFHKLDGSSSSRTWIEDYRRHFGTDAAIGQIRTCALGKMLTIDEQLVAVGQWQWSGAPLKQTDGLSFEDGDVLAGTELSKDASMLSSFGFSTIFRLSETLSRTQHRSRVETWLNESDAAGRAYAGHAGATPGLQPKLARTAR